MGAVCPLFFVYQMDLTFESMRLRFGDWFLETLNEPVKPHIPGLRHMVSSLFTREKPGCLPPPTGGGLLHSVTLPVFLSCYIAWPYDTNPWRK